MPLKYRGKLSLPAKGLDFGARPAEKGSPGAKRFTELLDCPSDYHGQAGKYPQVGATEESLVFGTPAGTTNHALLSNLTYATAAHTGFEPTVTKGNLTVSGSNLVIYGGTGAVIGAGTKIEATGATYTDEMAQDAVGAMIADTASVNLTYTDATPELKADVLPAGVDHNSLNNYSANRHIDHTTVTITAGTGLSGGGDISANRTIDCDITQYTDELAQDAVGGMIADTDTVDLTYTDATPELKADVKKQMSITSDASGIKLSGDATSPGNNQVYGTNGSGTKGWKADPTGSGGGVISTSATDGVETDIPVGGMTTYRTIVLTPTSANNQVLSLTVTLDAKVLVAGGVVTFRITGDFGTSSNDRPGTSTSTNYETLTYTWVFGVDPSTTSDLDFSKRSSYTINIQAQATNQDARMTNIIVKAVYLDSMDTTNKFGSWT